MQNLRRRLRSTVVDSAESSTAAATTSSDILPQWETAMVSDGPANLGAATAKPSHVPLNAAGHASALAASDGAKFKWDERHTAEWERPGMPVVMIPEETPGAEGISDGQRFEGLAYSCEECGFHFDLHFKPRKSILAWLKTSVAEMHHVEFLVVMLLPTCLAMSLILGWLQAVSLMQQISWPLAMIFCLLMAIHTCYWLQTGLEALRSRWEAYRDWEPQSDPWLIANLVERLAREQAETLTRANVTVHVADADGVAGDTGYPPSREAVKE